MQIVISLSNGQQYDLHIGAVAVLILAWVVVLAEWAKMARAARKAGCHGS